MFFQLTSTSTRGYGQLIGAARRHRPLTTIMLETLPPIFHVTLLSLLTYYSFYLNPDSAFWHLTSIFVVGQILANWFCFLRNKSVVPASPKNFPGYKHRYPSVTSLKDYLKDLQSENEEEMKKEWRECDSCDMHVPIRSHHCGHCRRCIYILDHHCYFLGHCVGRTNMRFFLVFCFYAAIGCGVGISNVIKVMTFYRNPYSTEAPYFILPFTFVMYFLGKANTFELLYVAMINFGLGACLICSFLFLNGLYSVFTGRTPYEQKKKKEAKLLVREGEFDEDDKSFLDRFRDVFGECGLLHFLLPMVPFEMPKVEVGYRRLITYNNDYILNGTIQSSETNLDYTP